MHYVNCVNTFATNGWSTGTSPKCLEAEKIIRVPCRALGQLSRLNLRTLVMRQMSRGHLFNNQLGCSLLLYVFQFHVNRKNIS